MNRLRTRLRASIADGPLVLLDFISGGLDPRITFTRGTTATFVGSNGLIQTAAINAPRFDYDPVTLAAKGLLIEEQRTNLLTYSEQFTDASWVVNGSPVITANAAVAPDGTSTADTMAVSGSSNGFGVYRNVVSSGTYASSIYFKLVSGAFSLRVGLTSNFSVINCSTLVITNTGTGVGSVTAVGNGWYRFVSVGTISVLSASEFYNIGSNTGTLAIWGAQLEAGAFATSYIPTVASTVTRSADVATMTGTNFSSWFNPVEGTLLANFVPTNSIANNTRAAAISDGVNRIVDIYIDTTVWRSFNGTTNVTPASSTAVLNSTVNFASAYKSGDYAAAMNGSAVGTAATAGVQSANKLNIGSNIANSNQINGHIRQIAYYNTRLPNAQLQTLTAPSLATTLSLSFTNQAYTVGV